MRLLDILGFVFPIVMVALIIIFRAAARERGLRSLREIPAFLRLRRAVGLAVEAGTRLHVSLGRGSFTGLQSGSALAGLSILERVTRAASISDRPPVATAGQGELGILSRDTLRAAFRGVNAENQYEPTSGRVSGLTPFSFAAGAMPVLREEQVSANVLAGHLGVEVALITDAAERADSLVVGGTDNLPGQAVLYAAAQEPLIGEELYAGPAYLGAGPMHEASLRAEDFFRWVLVGAMLVGALFSLINLGPFVGELLSRVLP